MQKAKPGYKFVKSLFGKYEEIPEDWEQKLFQNIITKGPSSGLYSPIENYGKGNKIVGLGDVFKSDVLQTEGMRKVDLSEDEKSRFILNSHDLVFSRYSLKFEGVGKCLFIPKINEIILFESNTLRVSLSDFVNSRYIAYYFNSEAGRRNLIRILKQVSSTGVTGTDLKNLKIILPPISEQEKITSILSSSDELISSYDNIITETKKLKNGLMQQLLTKGIGHKKFKKVKWLFGKEIEIPEEWDSFRLKQTCKKISVGIATSTTKHFVDNGVPLLRNQNIKNGYIDSKNLLYISEDFAKSNESKRLREGDVISMRTGYPGQSAVVPSNMDGWQTFTTLIIRPNHKLLSSDYLVLYLNSFGRKQITSTQAGAAQQNLNAGWASNLLIILPPLFEQQKIASILSSVDDKITELESKKKSLESLKKGLMQKLLTGQIRVSVTN